MSEHEKTANSHVVGCCNFIYLFNKKKDIAEIAIFVHEAGMHKVYRVVSQ